MKNGCIAAILLFLTPFLLLYVRACYLDYKEQIINSKSLIGDYSLDMNKSDLSDYSNDTLLYLDLEIKLNKNKSFKFNKEVPFIFDTTGTWAPAKYGLDEWHWLFFEKENRGNKIKTQFSNFDLSDSLIIFESMTPKPAKNNSGTLVFKKI